MKENDDITVIVHSIFKGDGELFLKLLILLTLTLFACDNSQVPTGTGDDSSSVVGNGISVDPSYQDLQVGVGFSNARIENGDELVLDISLFDSPGKINKFKLYSHIQVARDSLFLEYIGLGNNPDWGYDINEDISAHFGELLWDDQENIFERVWLGYNPSNKRVSFAVDLFDDYDIEAGTSGVLAKNLRFKVKECNNNIPVLEFKLLLHDEGTVNEYCDSTWPLNANNFCFTSEEVWPKNSITLICP